MTDTNYMYLFTRADLSKPQQIVQTAHAAAMIGERYHGQTHIVLCEARNEEHLKGVSDYLDKHNIDHEVFYEPDISAFTAIATQPLAGEYRTPMRKFQLMA